MTVCKILYNLLTTKHFQIMHFRKRSVLQICYKLSQITKRTYWTRSEVEIIFHNNNVPIALFPLMLFFSFPFYMIEVEMPELIPAAF